MVSGSKIGCVLFALLVPCASASAQVPTSSAEAIAAELATLSVCRAYIGGEPQNSMICEWPEAPLELLLAILTPAQQAELTGPRLGNAVLSLDASMGVTGYWQSRVTYLSQMASAKNKGGSRALEANDAIRFLAAVAALPGRPDEIARTAARIRASSEFGEVSSRFLKAKEAIFAVLNARPQDLQPFLERSPIPADLQAARKAMTNRSSK